MAFGITRQELSQWKAAVAREEVAFITHYWVDSRFPMFHTVTKVGCSNKEILSRWCLSHGLNPKYIHDRNPFPHFDLIGPKQKEILQKEGLDHQIKRFRLL